MSNNDRIRLAEAIGIRGVEGVKKHGPHAGWFDPFTSANDDYKVLQWMERQAKDYRQTDGTGYDIWHHFTASFDHRARPYHYRIGDYARAALQALPERQI